MKKLIGFALGLFFLFTLVGCGSKTSDKVYGYTYDELGEVISNNDPYSTEYDLLKITKYREDGEDKYEVYWKWDGSKCYTILTKEYVDNHKTNYEKTNGFTGKTHELENILEVYEIDSVEKKFTKLDE